jgi:hypothetical protein
MNTNRIPWSGLLFPTGQTSTDGRNIDPLPFPLKDEKGSVIGTVEKVWLQDGAVHGSGYISTEVSPPGARALADSMRVSVAAEMVGGKWDPTTGAVSGDFTQYQNGQGAVDVSNEEFTKLSNER